MSENKFELLKLLSAEWINCLKNLDDSNLNKQTLFKNETIYQLVLRLIDDYQNLLNHHFNADFEDLQEQISLIKNESTEFRLYLINNLVEQYQKIIMALTINEFEASNLFQKSWLLQQYSRQALSDTTLLQWPYYNAFLNYFLSDLPIKYKNVSAWLGATVKVEIVGLPNEVFTIEKGNENWYLTNKSTLNPSALIYIDQNIAWLLFSNGIDLMDAKHYYQIHGDAELASYVFKTAD